MFHLPKLQTAFGLGPLLRRTERRHLLQRLLRQELRRQGIRIRLWSRILAMQRCVSYISFYTMSVNLVKTGLS